jgi:spermidine/putrescine transport system substrate-binding protein
MRNFLFQVLCSCLTLAGLGILSGCGEVHYHPDYQRTSKKVATRSKEGHTNDSITVALRNENLLDPEVLADFRREFSCEVRLAYYETDDELHKMLQEKPYDYDLVFTTGHGIQRLVKQDMLNRTLVFQTNHVKFYANFLNELPFDPKYDFSLPYSWTILGIGYNGEYQKDIPVSWKSILEPDESMKSKITMFNNHRYVIGSALIYLGYSPNTTNRTEVDKAMALLQQQRKYVMEYNEHDSYSELHDAKAFLDQSLGCFMSEAAVINKQLRFSIPKEGTLIRINFMAIPKESLHQTETTEFIKFLVRPEVAGRNTTASHWASVVGPALSYVDRQVRNGPAYSYPTESSDIFYVTLLSPELEVYYYNAWVNLRRSPKPAKSNVP